MLLGLVATIVIPNLQNRIPGYKRKQFLAHVNALSRLTWQQALATQKAYRLFFDLDKRIIKVEAETEKKDKGGKPKFGDISIPYLNSTYQWADNIEIKQFYIDKNEMIARPGIKTEQVWFYCAPQGLVQSVIINMLDTSETDAQGKAITIGLVMNPFTGQFKEYDEFQKP